MSDSSVKRSQAVECEGQWQPLSDAAWFVCLTKPRQERVAQLHLEEQGYEVYVPLMAIWRRRSGQWQRTDSIMFPRYAFVRPGRVGQSISPARSTPGVTSLVSFGHILACISPDRVDALRALVESHGKALPSQPFRAGQHVTLASGPLKGLVGLVSSVAAERVTVMMSLLGREKLVVVPVAQLCPT